MTQSRSSLRVSRRRFLSGLMSIVGGAVVTIVGWPAIGNFVAGGARDQQNGEWLRIGSLSSLTPDTPTGFPFSRKITDGTSEHIQTGVAYAVTHNGRDVRVFSNVCTHLGCRLTWSAAQRSFVCPGHGGRFSADGEVLTGPPGHALEQFPARVDNGQISILVRV